MRRFARQLALVVALGLLPSVGYGVSNFDRHPVQARLVLDDDDIGAGDTLTAAIVLTMDDHWHTYWEFSGDAGLPTKIEWDLPDGMTAGPIQWAGPTRFVEAGDLTVFGYADEVSLLTSLTLADTAAFGRSTSPAELTARVSWLVCAEICIPGDTTLTVDLAAPASGLIDPGIIAEGSTH
ncbi:MAG: protein-disulfide reductase DsbD domain-containing protein, partial [Candidatus Latescibacterota bacterium]|nr:protein-disulfide reductase DsbD domain-containing protein [Candidatus Latescibacterota bacterium]